MIDFLFHPAILWPLLIDLALGGAAGGLFKRAGWRFLAWALIPLIVALLNAAQFGLFTQGGESQGWGMWAFVCLFPTGLVACGAGILFGCLLRRVSTAK